MLASHDATYACLALRHRRESDTSSHQPLLEERTAEVHSLAAFADDDGRNRRLALGRVDTADVESRGRKLLLEVVRIRPQVQPK